MATTTAAAVVKVVASAVVSGATADQPTWRRCYGHAMGVGQAEEDEGEDEEEEKKTGAWHVEMVVEAVVEAEVAAAVAAAVVEMAAAPAGHVRARGGTRRRRRVRSLSYVGVRFVSLWRRRRHSVSGMRPNRRGIKSWPAGEVMSRSGS